MCPLECKMSMKTNFNIVFTVVKYCTTMLNRFGTIGFIVGEGSRFIHEFLRKISPNRMRRPITRPSRFIREINIFLSYYITVNTHWFFLTQNDSTLTAVIYTNSDRSLWQKLGIVNKGLILLWEYQAFAIWYIVSRPPYIPSVLNDSINVIGSIC